MGKQYLPSTAILSDSTKNKHISHELSAQDFLSYLQSLLQQQAGCSRAQNLKMTANSSVVPGREPQQ